MPEAIVYFTSEEFACKCGCELSNMDEDFMKKLYLARQIANIPFNITSGSRCISHNLIVGGSNKSSHLNGKACDIACVSNTERFSMIDALLAAGFTRLGIADQFIHVDLDMEKTANTIWTYN